LEGENILVGVNVGESSTQVFWEWEEIQGRAFQVLYGNPQIDSQNGTIALNLSPRSGFLAIIV
jgi:hypothetical protein